MEIVDYESKYKNDLARLFNNFHNHMVAIDHDGLLKPLENQKHILKYVNKMIDDSESMNGYIYLAIVDDKTIGFSQGIIQNHKNDDFYQLVSRPSSQGWIGELYVEKNYRKQGIGQVLFNKAKQHFVNNGCVSLRLYVFEHNKEAYELYTGLGMKPRNIEMDLKL